MNNKDPYFGKYFAFSIKNLWSEHIYGESITNSSCIIFQKDNNLVPVGEISLEWLNFGTDRPLKLMRLLN